MRRRSPSPLSRSSRPTMSRLVICPPVNARPLVLPPPLPESLGVTSAPRTAAVVSVLQSVAAVGGDVVVVDALPDRVVDVVEVDVVEDVVDVDVDVVVVASSKRIDPDDGC